MSKINVEKILSKRIKQFPSSQQIADMNHENILRNVKAAIKEIVELAIDKCAEEAKVERTNGVLKLPTEFVDKQSILKVKEMIDYD